MNQEYKLKGSEVDEIFKKILKDIRDFVEVVQIYRLANDYASLILSNPNSTPEILFEEELNNIIDEHSSDNNYAVCGNLSYETQSIWHLMVFINKTLVARLYGIEFLDRNESRLSVQFNEKFENEIYKKIVNLITEIIKEKTLFKE